YSNQDIPFEALVDELKPERNLSYTTMFQITFNLDNNEKSVMQLPGVEVTPVTKNRHTAKFDLNFAAGETPQGLSLSWGYAASLFHAATIERMAASFETLLNAILANPHEDIQRLRLASEAEQALVREWNEQKADFPTGRTIQELFEEHVRRTPEAIALVRRNESLTYAELNGRANRLAHLLRERGVANDTFVGICAERSFDMIVAMIAILKAGGAYVPLDPNYPAARIKTIADDCGATIILTQSHLTDVVRGTGCELLFLDQALDRYPDSDPECTSTAEDVAHLIYTSGSTGLPKGVMVEHLGVVRLVINNHYVPFNPGTRMLQVSTCTFDAATWEIWGSLLNGGQLILYPERVLDLAELNAQIDTHAVNTILLTAGLFEQWSHQLPKGGTLQYLLSGGDVVSPAGVARIYRELPQVEVINAYGPTENAVISACYSIPRDADFGRALPIGKAINGTTLYVLTEAMQPLPVGAVGELFVGGAGVARGYWNQPELTAKKFVAVDGERLYRTGDLVRYLPDGSLEFIGRADDQVKIRGFRIELGEIATQLLRFEDVKDALVLARGPGTSKRLVAYIIPAGDDVDVDDLKQRLRQQLPEYMVPSAIVVMEAFPLNSSGKVNKQLLTEPDFQQTDSYVAPRTKTERQLAAIWQQLLKLERVGIDDNFFAIGGDSILSIQAVSRANQAGIAITTRQLFEYQTIAALAAQARTGVTIVAPQEAITGALSLLPIQQELLGEGGEEAHHFNQSVLLRAPADFRFAFVPQMLAAIYARHDALRLRFRSDDHGAWTATHAPLSDEMLAASSIREALPADAALRAAFITARCDHYQRQFDLAAGPLFKVIYFEGDDEGRLFLLAHHIIVDGVSWRILLADIERAYGQFQAGEPIALGAKTSSFQQWGDALETYATSNELRNERAYWLAQYDHPTAPLPVDFVPGEVPTTESTKRVRIRLTPAETQALLQRSGQAYRTTINELLLSGVYLGMRQWTGSEALRVALEGHGRETLFEQLDTTQTVGWFTSVYPLALHSRNARIDEVIKSIKEQYRALPNNGIGFGVLRYIANDAELLARDAGNQPQVVFNYLGQFDQSVNAETAFQAAVESTGSSHSDRQPRPYHIVLNGKVAGGELAFALDYSELQYRPETMAALAGNIENGLRAVIEHCTSIERGAFTPSDFPLARASQEQ
ncbi:MAG: peptide synthetase, partial [Acidobacteria bacterium]|nr:peptide synthetase [Acidobacteriota bacterium]